MLDHKEEATYRSEDESIFTLMTIMIIISYILYTVLSELSALSVFLCSVLVLCVILYLRMLYMNVLFTMLNIVLENAMHYRRQCNYLYFINMMP